MCGPRSSQAKLRFATELARKVTTEQSHPQQKGSTEADGRYVLELPYADDRELLMDILKYGAAVEVLAPQSLRERLKAEVRKMAENYE